MALDTILKKTVKAGINNLRAGWHGIAAMSIGILILSQGDINTNPTALGGVLPLAMGPVFYINALEAYKKTKRNIGKYGGLQEGSSHRYMDSYCTRQGARVAAINAGLKEKFDRARETFKGYQEFKWIPHI